MPLKNPVRTFASGREYYVEVDFSRGELDVSELLLDADGQAYFSAVARTLMDFVDAGLTYRIVNATEAFNQAVRRAAKSRGIAIYYGFQRDQYGRPVSTGVRLLTLKENMQ